MVNYDLMLDTHKAGVQASVKGIKTGDTESRELIITLSDGGRPLSITSDSIATIWCEKEDGSTAYTPCEIKNGKVHHTIKTSETDVVGDVVCELRITKNGKVLTAPRFVMSVEGIIQTDGAVESQNDFSALTEALGRVIEAESGLSSKADKVSGTPGNLAVIGGSGNLADSGLRIDKIATSEWVKAYVDEAIVEGEW